MAAAPDPQQDHLPAALPAAKFPGLAPHRERVAVDEAFYESTGQTAGAGAAASNTNRG